MHYGKSLMDSFLKLFFKIITTISSLQFDKTFWNEIVFWLEQGDRGAFISFDSQISANPYTLTIQ